MACLDNDVVKVDVLAVSISSGIADKDSRIVMAVQFGRSFARSFNTDTGSEDLQMSKVGFTPVPSFKRGPTGTMDDSAVVKVYRVEECHGPVFCVQGRAV